VYIRRQRGVSSTVGLSARPGQAVN